MMSIIKLIIYQLITDKWIHRIKLFVISVPLLSFLSVRLNSSLTTRGDAKFHWATEMITTMQSLLIEKKIRNVVFTLYIT